MSKSPSIRAVGLDRPCNHCGKPIYYNYKGPIDGLCGRCADKALSRRPRRDRTRTVLVRRNGRSAALWLLVLLAFAAGAVAVIFFRRYLPF